ncbi:MAG: GIY-YIG nuclease family protein [Brevinema sp.]
MEEGIIYILTNPATPDYIKIGTTTRQDLKTRMKELYSTGVPFPFSLYYAVKISNAKNIEKQLHQIFSIHRDNSDREFFRMDPERAMVALRLTGGQPII